MLPLVADFSSSREQSLAVPYGGNVLYDDSHSRCSSEHEVFTAVAQCSGSSAVGGRTDFLGRLLTPGSSVVVRRQPSRRGDFSRSPSAAPPLHGCIRLRVGGFPRRRSSIQLMDSGHISLYHQPSRVVNHSFGCSGVSSPASGQLVSLFTDNTTALAYLRKEEGTRSSTINSVAQSTLRLCESNDVRLLPQFVPGKLIILADSLSRGSQVLGSEWTLCQEVCRDLFHRWLVTIDLFATSMHHRLQAYFSPVMDPLAMGTDAIRQSWDGLQAYAFPPFGFLPNVLTKVRQSRNLEVTLVAPFWPLKPWFLDILELLIDVLVLLPLRKDLLCPPHFHHFHWNLIALHMTGFRIASEQRAILISTTASPSSTKPGTKFHIGP